MPPQFAFLAPPDRGGRRGAGGVSRPRTCKFAPGPVAPQWRGPVPWSVPFS